MAASKKQLKHTSTRKQAKGQKPEARVKNKQQQNLHTMKKLILTLAIVLGLGLTTFAQGGGLFQRGASESVSSTEGNRDGVLSPSVPDHGQSNNQSAPLGSGAVVLIGLGAAYLVGKRRKEE
jgi:uncharacterized protein HemX